MRCDLQTLIRYQNPCETMKDKQERKCEICKIDISGRHGNTVYCKECAEEQDKENQKIRSAKYKQTHKRALQLYHRKYKQEHRDQINANARRWAAQNRERQVEKNRQYREDHPAWWVEQQLKQKKQRRWRKYRDNYYEVTVGVDCLICDEFVLAKSTKKMFCKTCSTKFTSMIVPKNVKWRIMTKPQWLLTEVELLWKRVYDLRAQGVIK